MQQGIYFVSYLLRFTPVHKQLKSIKMINGESNGIMASVKDTPALTKEKSKIKSYRISN